MAVEAVLKFTDNLLIARLCWAIGTIMMGISKFKLAALEPYHDGLVHMGEAMVVYSGIRALQK